MTAPLTPEALAGGRCMRREAKAFTCECGQHAWKFFRHKYVLMVDADQVDAITGLLWGESASGYAIIHAGRKGVSKNIYLHRILFDPGDMRVDHVNRNKTDNRRVNLRTATQSQNVVNYWRPIPPGSPRKYRGICKSRQPGKWRARIKWEKRCITIGTFSTQEDAARAYDARARELYGEFALCNFPEARDAAE